MKFRVKKGLVFPFWVKSVRKDGVIFLCEGGGGKPARAEAAGDAAAKKRACKLFLPLCVPTANACGLGTVDRPRAQRGGTPKRKIKLFLIATFLIRDLFQRKILFLH